LNYHAPVLFLSLALMANAERPEPGDPVNLVDLRWLARPATAQRFVIDTLSGKDTVARVGRQYVIADIAGPGVMDHLMLGRVKQITLNVDGEIVLACDPHKAWKRVYPVPKHKDRGRLPFAFPLVQVAGPYAHCALPIPFRKRLLLTSNTAQPKAWLAGRRLQHVPRIAFSTSPDSPFVRSLSKAYGRLRQAVDALVNDRDSRDVKSECYCAAGKRAVLVEIDGPGEIVGMRLRILPGAEDLLRYQVINITIDGASSVRMPLVDFLGVSHPWPHAWFPMAGDWAAGIVHPYKRSGGQRQPAVVAYFKLPIPFARSLRIQIRNRSPRRPVTFYATLQIVPLGDHAEEAGRLCGTSQRIALSTEGTTTLFDFRDGQGTFSVGNLVGVSMFTTGHQRNTGWRRQNRIELVDSTGVAARGPGLLPLGMQGLSENIVFGSLLWNHNSLDRTGRCGAGRHFWRDPPPVRAGSVLRYVAKGEGGPTRAEVGVLWYRFPLATAYTAPDVPGSVETLPATFHAQPHKPPPGGWAAEAETFAASAEATAGIARAETAGAKDAFASGDAYLAWNAERHGDGLDLLAPMPKTAYIRLWVHRLLFPSGGVFNIKLAPPENTNPRLRMSRSDAEFRGRLLGFAQSHASVDCYDIWPHRQAYRFEMPIMHNPAPGRRGRIRFLCVSKRLDSRGYLLAIDQLGIDPAPASPPGWYEFEDAAVLRCDREASADLMAQGRADFFAWGGCELIARGPSSVSVGLMEPLANPPQVDASRYMLRRSAPPSQRGHSPWLELRGIVKDGEWTAQVDDGKPQPVALEKKKKEPSVWCLRLPKAEQPPMALTLNLRCTSHGGRLLLDAWRLSRFAFPMTVLKKKGPVRSSLR